MARHCISAPFRASPLLREGRQPVTRPFVAALVIRFAKGKGANRMTMLDPTRPKGRAGSQMAGSMSAH